jgi:hypothetical protein
MYIILLVFTNFVPTTYCNEDWSRGKLLSTYTHFRTDSEILETKRNDIKGGLGNRKLIVTNLKSQLNAKPSLWPLCGPSHKLVSKENRLNDATSF